MREKKSWRRDIISHCMTGKNLLLDTSSYMTPKYGAFIAVVHIIFIVLLILHVIGTSGMRIKNDGREDTSPHLQNLVFADVIFR